MRGFFLLVFFLLSLSQSWGAEENSPPREIAYTLFARLPLLEKVALAPNGEFFAVLYPNFGETLFTIFDIRKNSQVDPVPLDISNQNIAFIDWGSNDRLLVGHHGFSFSINGILFSWAGEITAIDKDGKNPKRLLGSRSPNKGYFYYKLLDPLDENENKILIELWKLGEKGPTVYQMDIYSGDLEVVTKPRKNIFTWFSDYDGVVRLGVGLKRKKPVIVFRVSENDKWLEIQDREIFEDGEFQLIGFGFESSRLFFLSSHETGRQAVYEYDVLENAIVRKVFDHPRYDVTGLLLNLRDKTVDAGYYFGDFLEYSPLNENFRKWQKKIRKALGGLHFEILDSSRDENYYILRSYSEKDPGSLYFFDDINNELSPIWEVLPSLFPENMNPVEKIIFKARDGLEIEGYLTIPKGMRKKNLPTIINPHGGPWERDNMIFDVQSQFLANRGFAVLQLNFRGSSGYGTKFREMGYGEWGGKMQTDIQDGLFWLIENGITNPEKVCILGASYGGYAALLALAQYPEDYKCGIALARVTDLNLLLKEQKNGFSEKLIKKAVKSKMSRRDLKKKSPYKLVDQIEDPLLLFHGTIDAKVPFEHSEKMVEELEKEGKDFKFIKMENMGHELFDEKFRFMYFKEIEKFLKLHLYGNENETTKN